VGFSLVKLCGIALTLARTAKKEVGMMLGPSLRVPNPLTHLATAAALTVALANTAHPAGALTPTPTAATPAAPTSTKSAGTPTAGTPSHGSPTATKSAVRTATGVRPPRFNDDDSCRIVAPGRTGTGGGLALLLAPALLLWARRRRL
jgi:hypothetical protein